MRVRKKKESLKVKGKRGKAQQKNKEERGRERQTQNRSKCYNFLLASVLAITLRHNICEFVRNFRPTIISCQQNPRLAITFFSCWRHIAFRKNFYGG